MKLSSRFRFEAAHHLINYNGPCANMHGHSYVLEVSVFGEVGPDGFVVDFGELKQLVEQHIVSIYDHAYLNRLLHQPTAENLLLDIKSRLCKASPLFTHCELVLYETHKNWATLCW